MELQETQTEWENPEIVGWGYDSPNSSHWITINGASSALQRFEVIFVNETRDFSKFEVDDALEKKISER